MRLKLYQSKKLKRLPFRQLVVLVSILVPFSPGALEAKTFLSPQSISSMRDISVSGKVVDEKGIGLPGVSVQIKGTSVGAVTDANGSYSISVPDNLAGRNLTFSYLGYISQEVPIAGKKTINVQLKAGGENALDDVVVVGYGTQKRVSITGAVSTIDAKKY